MALIIAPVKRPVKTFMLRSGEVETVKVHDFVPHHYKVVQELLPGVLTSVDFRQGPELGVRTEDQVDTGAGPLECACCTITPLEHVFVFRRCLPRRAHVEQIHEEVIGERLRPLREDAVLGPSEVGLQDAHAAKENRHFGSGQCQQLRLVNQQLLCRYAVFGFEVVAEAVRLRLEDSEGGRIGLLLRDIHASRREGNGHIVAGILRRLLDARATGQNDQISQRYLLAA